MECDVSGFSFLFFFFWPGPVCCRPWKGKDLGGNKLENPL